MDFIRLINKKVPNNTFDDLWDWRLKQGNMLVGKDMKNSIDIYHPNQTKHAAIDSKSRLTNELSNDDANKARARDDEGDRDRDSDEDTQQNDEKR